MVNYEDVLKATAEHFLVHRFPNDEKKRGSSDEFQSILNEMLHTFIYRIIKTASLSENKSLGRPAANTAAVNVMPADKIALYEKYHTWAKEQKAKDKAEHDESYKLLKGLVSAKLTTMCEKYIAADDDVTIRNETMIVSIAMVMTFVDMFVAAVVAARHVRGVEDIVTKDLLVAGQRSLCPIFFDAIKYKHGGDNGLPPVVPKRRAPANPDKPKKMRKPSPKKTQA